MWLEPVELHKFKGDDYNVYPMYEIWEHKFHRKVDIDDFELESWRKVDIDELKELNEISSKIEIDKEFKQEDLEFLRNIDIADDKWLRKIRDEANNTKNIETKWKKNIIKEDLDFTKAWSFAKFRKKDANYMIASAENPMWKQATKAMNKKTHKAFAKFMKENKIEHKAQLWVYDNPENSYIIKIESPEQRKMIDKWLEENSPQAENIIIKDWKAVRYNPRTKEAHSVDLKDKDISLVDENITNYYSEIDWKKYRLPLYEAELENPISIKELYDLYNN